MGHTFAYHGDGCMDPIPADVPSSVRPAGEHQALVRGEVIRMRVIQCLLSVPRTAPSMAGPVLLTSTVTVGTQPG